jgi:nucleolar GTP-binding protein
MFKSIPLLRTDEIINKAFSRTSKIVLKQRGSRSALFKKREFEMVSRSAEIIIASLQKILDRYPRFSELDRFTVEMIKIVIDVDELWTELAAIRQTINSIVKVKNNSLKKIEKEKDKVKIVALRKDAYGKYASLLRNLDPISASLNNKREKMKEIPPISADDYTVVIAGYPNVGKSTILSKLTISKPKIAAYPFTTTGINIGNFIFKYQVIKLIDTPGVLDRPLLKRNEIERKAISAIAYLANILIFVIDASDSRKYTIEEQLSLYSEVRELFPMPTILVQNKLDVSEETVDADIKVSAVEGTGIDKLKDMLIDMISKDPAFNDFKTLEL